MEEDTKENKAEGEEKPKRTRSKKAVTEENKAEGEEKPKRTRSKKAVTEENKAEGEEKPKRTRSKKAVTEENKAEGEEKPKRTRSKKAATEENKAEGEEKPKRRVRKSVKEEKNIQQNIKAQKLGEYFTERKLQMFRVENLDDINETTVFRSNIKIGDRNLPMAIVVDRTAYILIQVELLSALAPTKQQFDKFATALMKLNNAIPLFKLTISSQGDLMLNSVLTFTNKNFDPIFLHTILLEIVKYLEEDYGPLVQAIMKIMK